MYLAIDIGNSSAKAALFEEGRIVRVFNNIGGIGDLPVADRTIVVSTNGEIPDIKGALRLDHTTPVPIRNLYASPGTLGYDRLAAAVGAHAMFPGKTVLTVDFGTAITYDIVTARGEFLGGNISPGAHSRFRALNEFTGTLPLGTLPERTGLEEVRGADPMGVWTAPAFPARDTRSAVENGVVTGIMAETEHYIAAAMNKFGGMKIIFTGGDADYFAGRVKFPIFAVSDLVFYGLNAILEHNANL